MSFCLILRGCSSLDPLAFFCSGSNPSPAPAQKSTTLYVGKIASSVSDETIQTLLTACGPVKSWKPMQDPETNKSKGFGFCEYETAEGVLRALRLLHNLSLDGQELLLKCNTATQRYIDDYQTSKQRQAERKKQEASQPDGDAEVKAEAETEETDDQQDDAILAKIMALASDRAAQQAGSIAADQATDLLNDILPPPPSRDRRSLGRDQLSASKERTHSSREQERGTSADRNAERQLERERQREKREVEMRQAEQERAYQKRLKEWEHTERYLLFLPSGQQAQVPCQLRANTISPSVLAICPAWCLWSDGFMLQGP